MLTLTQREDKTWLLSGQVTVDTINSVLPVLNDMMASPESALVWDLSPVTRADSSSLALLLEAMRLASIHSKTIRFTNYPQKMRDIIQVSNLNAILL